MLLNYDEIDYLKMCMKKHYPPIKLKFRNIKDFENRCHEINICEDILESMMDNILTDPEEILFEYFLSIECECNCFKNNKKRLYLIKIKEQVIEYLDKKLKIFRGESI